MKKLILFILFLLFLSAGYSQAENNLIQPAEKVQSSYYTPSPWDGFFRPMSMQQFDRLVAARGDKSINPKLWVFRPVVEVSAIKLSYDKELKQVSSASFTSMGFGLGYQHYINIDGLPYNNFGFNLLMLYTAIPTETTKSGISLAGTVSALKFLDVGLGFDFDIKQVFGLMGIKYNF